MAMKRRVVGGLLGLAVALALVHGAAEKPGPGADPHADDSPVFRADAAVDRIRFDHARHAEMACSGCHAGAQTSRRADDLLTPPMAACAECHQATEPKLQECGACHVGHDLRASEPITKKEEWEAFRPAPMPAPRSRSAIRFDHQLHVALARKKGGEGCASCHGSARSGKMAMPSMASCQSCHDGSSSGPSADCATCHPTEGATLKTNLGGSTLAPSNHTVDWLARHGNVAASQPDECASCHLVEEDCAGCHVEEVARPFAVHPPNYLAIHSVDARSDMGECTDCHNTETFCQSCHVDARAVTRPIGRPPDRLTYHPAGWLDGSQANNHGVMARRNINECASCHTEQDCVTCHAGINPHPPGFALECQKMVKANPAPCRACHTEIPRCF